MTSLSGRHFLVVEDESLVAMYLEDMLLEIGAAEVCIASSVRDAMATLAEAHFDAAILDLNLDGERSLAVAGRLREKGVPFVFATGYGETEAAETAGELVLPKPYTQDDLAKVLAKLLQLQTQ